MRCSLIATVGSYEGIDENLVLRLEKIPKGAPYEEVVRTLNVWVKDSMHKRKIAEMRIYSPPLI